MMDLNHAFRRLARATFTTATSHVRNKEKLEALKAIIQRAADEIEAIAK
jgi:hypothetical protein